jgi:hypothetical protein
VPDRWWTLESVSPCTKTIGYIHGSMMPLPCNTRPQDWQPVAFHPRHHGHVGVDDAHHRSCGRGAGAASVASFQAAVLTQIYLCNVCSRLEIMLRRATAAGQPECLPGPLPPNCTGWHYPVDPFCESFCVERDAFRAAAGQGGTPPPDLAIESLWSQCTSECRRF